VSTDSDAPISIADAKLAVVRFLARRRELAAQAGGREARILALEIAMQEAITELGHLYTYLEIDDHVGNASVLKSIDILRKEL
jgi:hypothetical protein